METLYRKYRPQKFSELVGQNHIRSVLEGELASGRIAHAYLFSGPRGVGKTSVARIFAKAVNCADRKDGKSEPCGKCVFCEEIKNNISLDVIEIDAASHTGVDHVREQIIDNVRFAPSKLKYKVFIIDEVHMLSTSAFNALLKTLEEPPAHAIFILATTELHKVPETIISRCQRFDFKRVNDEAIIGMLKSVAAAEEIKIAPKVFEAIASASEGCPRDAESLLGQILVLDEKEITVEQASLVLPESHRSLVSQFLGLIAAQNASEAVRLVNKMVDDGVELEAFSKETVQILRELLLLKLSAPPQAAPADFLPEYRDAIDQLTPSTIVNMIEKINGARRELERADIAQLPLELAAVELCL